MQIRCTYCHKPYALGKEAIHMALEMMTEQELGHYNAPCPHCRKINRVSRDELSRAAPDWVKGAAQAEAEGKSDGDT